MGGRHYTAYGLRIRSELALPYFRPAPAAEPDVTVRYGAVPRALPATTRGHGPWQAAPGVFLMRVDDTARYLVTAGREILVELLDGADGDLVTVLLMGSVWTALLQQRGLLTLHASAVRAGTGAALFLGASGSGKSTLAAALAARGHATLCDDVAAVRSDASGPPTVLPGFPHLRLWADALDRLGSANGTLARVRPDLAKYLLPAERFSAGRCVVRVAYVLTAKNRDAVELVPKRPAEALMWLRKYTHRGKFVDGFGHRRAHFGAVSRIARDVPLVRVIRPSGAFRLDALAERIEGDLARRCA